MREIDQESNPNGIGAAHALLLDMTNNLPSWRDSTVTNSGAVLDKPHTHVVMLGAVHLGEFRQASFAAMCAARNPGSRVISL